MKRVARKKVMVGTEETPMVPAPGSLPSAGDSLRLIYGSAQSQ